MQEQKDIRNDVISHVLRCLADALIWRATGYERAAFAVFGDGVRVGRLSNEEGFTTERARAQKWLDQGVLAFFNDLTNCMRTGDLTIMDRPGVGANLAVEEVKRSGPAPSESRQAKRYDRKLKLLQTNWKSPFVRVLTRTPHVRFPSWLWAYRSMSRAPRRGMSTIQPRTASSAAAAYSPASPFC